MFIPCPFEFQPSPPVWRIGGIDFTSSTLPSIFTLDPGGIYINNVTACLNGLTFQCIDTSGAGLLGRGSLTGILTVQPPGQVCGGILLYCYNTVTLFWFIDIGTCMYAHDYFDAIYRGIRRTESFSPCFCFIWRILALHVL